MKISKAKFRKDEVEGKLTRATGQRCGDYLILENKFAKIRIEHRPYEEDPENVYIVSGDVLSAQKEYPFEGIGAALQFAAETLSRYVEGRAD